MKRADAFAVVRRAGGSPREGVTKDTGVLIVGELGWPLLDDGRPSNSLAQARTYGVPITSERRFLEWIGRSAADDQAKAYTAGQLASLSKLPEEVVEQLGLFGLVAPEDGRYGFRDLAAARQIAALLSSGVALSVITKSLSEVRKWLPEARLSSLRLFPESSDSILVEQLAGRTDKKGQFVLPIAPDSEDADALFEAARAAEEAGDTKTAERLYRRCQQADPEDAAIPFNLANLLRADGRSVEAEAAYRDAIKADPRFAAAWYNLADALDDQGRTAEAVRCLGRALDADPSYADALFNLALFQQRLERYAEAAVAWRKYLGLDAASQWAARAKRALKLCEIQVAGAAGEPS
jgi:tetratricopeptide (TPR) repeat protein